MDKQDRKEILRGIKTKEQEKLVSILPMSVEQLGEFFDYLDNKLNKNTENSLVYTKEFCENKKIDFEKVKGWVEELNGYDDSEILWNVEEQYEFLLKEK